MSLGRYLFRGICKETKKWVFGMPITSVNDRRYIVHGATGDAINTMNEVDFVFSEIISESVGQWTGLVDKDGVKIFEGDKDSRGMIVVYDVGMSGYYLMKNGEGFHLSHEQSLLRGRLPHIKIIGSIHDHLLGKKQ